MCINTLRPRQNGRYFADDIFKWIFLNENVWISIKISLKFVPQGSINNIPSLVQIMAWRRPGNKPLSESKWLVYRRIYASLGFNELTIYMQSCVWGNDGIFIFYICRPRWSVDNNNRHTGEIMTCLFDIANTMAPDDPAMQGTDVSTALVLPTCPEYSVLIPVRHISDCSGVQSAANANHVINGSYVTYTCNTGYGLGSDAQKTTWRGRCCNLNTLATKQNCASTCTAWVGMVN